MKKVNHFLEHFFNPESVAIVGATDKINKLNFRLTHNLVNLGFRGRIYPVNPNQKEVLGVKAFPRLTDINDKVDLVVSAVPAVKTIDIVRDCASIGVKHLVIISGGFSEGGQDGRKLHKEIFTFIKKTGLRVLGPNTLSPINTANNMAISFNPIKKLTRGGLSLAFQSGFYDPIINWIFPSFNINKILDMGNKMDINELDALDYFSKDSDTSVLAMHIESLQGDAVDFFNHLRATSREKPVIILKSGRTLTGSQIALTHTGNLVNEDDLIFDGMIKQTSAIRAQNIEEFFDLAKAFELLELPRGNRIAIITISGGEGVMASDACETNGLRLADLNNTSGQRLRNLFPPWEIPLNPFDIGVCMEFHLSDPHRFFSTLAVISEDENVDCIIMQMYPFMPSGQTSLDQNISEKEEYVKMLLSAKKNDKPFALWRSSMNRDEGEWIDLIESNRVPVFQSAERAIKALSAMYRYKMRHS